MKILSLFTQNLHIIKHSGQKLLYPKKQMQKDIFIRQNTYCFSSLNYIKSKDLKDAALFAEKMFGVKNFNISDLSSANLLNQTFTKIYNITRGKAEFPPIVSIKSRKNSRFSGECGILHIEVIKNPYMADDIIHEIGHYNHQKSCKDYNKMGKLAELQDDGITDLSIYEEFKNDQNAQKLIKKHIHPYATSSAAEFVACTFNAIINGKKLPPEIYELYKKYEGPCAEIFINSKTLKTQSFI